VSLDDVDLGALPPGAGERLDRFAAAFLRLDAQYYVLFATRPDDEDRIQGAVDRADEALGSATRRDAAWAAIDAFIESAAGSYSRRLPLSDTLLLYQSVPDRAEDRVLFARNLEAALLGLIAWDALDDEDLGLLLGPFAELIERSVVGTPPGDVDLEDRP
jgi:hypothetical protein